MKKTDVQCAQWPAKYSTLRERLCRRVSWCAVWLLVVWVLVSLCNVLPRVICFRNEFVLCSVLGRLFLRVGCFVQNIYRCWHQGWKPCYLALGCQFQFRCVETQMSGFSFGLVSRLLKNRFQFWLRITSVSGFQFRFKFHPKKLFYFEYGFFKCFTF